MRIVFALALRLGKTVEQLLNEISSKELTQWFAYFSIEPFDEQRGDIRSAIIAATVANVAPRNKGAKSYHPRDFLPFRAPISAKAIRASLAHFVRKKSHGG